MTSLTVDDNDTINGDGGDDTIQLVPVMTPLKEEKG